MRLKNTQNAYGMLTKIFHWPTAFIILGLILVGLYMGSLPNGPDKFEIYALHKSFGILVLWLVGLRLLWRFLTKQPDHHQNHQLWERFLAKLARLLLYVAMIGMPLSGWLMSSAGEYPVPFFGLQMPDLVGKNPDLAKLMHEVHEILSYVLIAAIGLHAVGALKHHFIDGDNTLVRMMANPIRRFGPYVLMIILGGFALGVVKLGILDKASQEKPAVETSGVAQEQEVSKNNLGQNEWMIVKDQSHLSFKASVYGKEFTGEFPDFDGTIIFDPDDLAASRADITIKTSDIDSGDVERDTQMLGEEWFNIAEFPTARFKTLAFEHVQEDNYVAVGELIIKNRAMPVSLLFRLDIVEAEENTHRAFMNGQATLNRLDFGLGEGRWEVADSIGLDVIVAVKLVAVSKN